MSDFGKSAKMRKLWFRSTQQQRTKLPESLWQAAVDLARQHGVCAVAHPLPLDYTRLKKRLGDCQLKAREDQADLHGTDRAAPGDAGRVRYRDRVDAR